MESHDNVSSCANSTCGKFNYCLVAKTIVAIAAIPMIGAVVAGFFTNPAWQFTMATYSGALVVLVAQRIDRMKAFSAMVVKKKRS
ncbi:MAG: hypothetical protein ACKVOE_04350 [Rickettsiales bacterium]